jgi:hypothetical protein
LNLLLLQADSPLLFGVQGVLPRRLCGNCERTGQKNADSGSGVGTLVVWPGQSAQVKKMPTPVLESALWSFGRDNRRKNEADTPERETCGQALSQPVNLPLLQADLLSCSTHKTCRRAGHTEIVTARAEKMPTPVLESALWPFVRDTLCPFMRDT